MLWYDLNNIIVKLPSKYKIKWQEKLLQQNALLKNAIFTLFYYFIVVKIFCKTQDILL